jgi:hypothetical protein
LTIEGVTHPMSCADDRLRAVIIQDSAEFLHESNQRSVRNKRAGPQSFVEVGLSNHTWRFVDQQKQ